MTELSLIVAMDDNRLIGRNNDLPWQMPADLAYFKRTTMGKPIIMGRKTFTSIGRSLPGRRNIVISRNPAFKAANCEVANGIRAALSLCSDAEEAMLIGGASLYQQAIDQATRLYVTRIHHRFEGDTWFPKIDLKLWKQETREDHDADHNNPYSYSFVTLSTRITNLLTPDSVTD